MKLLIDGSGRAGVIILAHGAGMSMDHSYMEMLVEKLCRIGLRVVRFEFEYMALKRETGKQRLPDKMPILEQCYLEVVKEVAKNVLIEDQVLYLAGKSLGGRVATRIERLLPVGLNMPCVFVIGYPFHPIKKPSTLRIDHFDNLKNKVFIFQGERDKLGCKEEVLSYELGCNVLVHWLVDGDHDLKPRVKSGFTQEQHLDTVVKHLDSIVTG